MRQFQYFKIIQIISQWLNDGVILIVISLESSSSSSSSFSFSIVREYAVTLPTEYRLPFHVTRLEWEFSGELHWVQFHKLLIGKISVTIYKYIESILKYF